MGYWILDSIGVMIPVTTCHAITCINEGHVDWSAGAIVPKKTQIWPTIWPSLFIPVKVRIVLYSKERKKAERYPTTDLIKIKSI